MIHWENIIGSKMRPAARTAEMVASERKKEYNRKREATPERKAAHRAYNQTEAGRASMARRNKKWRESERYLEDFISRRRYIPAVVHDILNRNSKWRKEDGEI